MGILKAVGLVFVGLCVVGAIVGKDEKPSQSRPTATVAPAAQVASVAAAPVAQVAQAAVIAPAPVVARIKAAPKMPADQDALVQINQMVRVKWKEAGNDLQRGALRPWRSKATCLNIKTTAAKNWVGTLETLSTNNDGKGVVSIKIGDDIAVKTWNNSLSDIASDTLIDPSSSLYQQIATLNEGDTVIFSGRFFQSDVDCLQEGSVTLSGSLSDPEYIMKFEDIRKAN